MIEAGPELDIEVAEAIGMQYAGYYRKGPFYCWRGDQTDLKNHKEVGVKWCPSTDLNAAFEAAEQVRLFELWIFGKTPRGWCFEDFQEGPIVCTLSPTPALAICAAILKLKEGDSLDG
jgi:hypothetical protein